MFSHGVDMGHRVMNGVVMVSLHPRGLSVIVPEVLEPLGIFLSGWPFSCITIRKPETPITKSEICT